MSKDILIRNVSEKVNDWIEDERYQRKMSKQDFVCQVLGAAREYEQGTLFNETPPAAQPSPSLLPYTFIDLFAEIGGFRLGLQKTGGSCVFSCEWDIHAQKTYHAWFGETPFGDIRKLKPSDISGPESIQFHS